MRVRLSDIRYDCARCGRDVRWTRGSMWDKGTPYCHEHRPLRLRFRRLRLWVWAERRGYTLA